MKSIQQYKENCNLKVIRYDWLSFMLWI
jgi:hypothetical protein